jgi:hypothetical protein
LRSALRHPAGRCGGAPAPRRGHARGRRAGPDAPELNMACPPSLSPCIARLPFQLSFGYLTFSAPAPPARTRTAMRAALEHPSALRAAHRTRGADVSAIRAHTPGAGDDGLAAGLELLATAAAGRDAGHAPHPEHRERWPGPTATAHAGPMQPWGSVRAARDAGVSISS